MQKLLTFLSKNISVYAIFNNQSFNDMLTNDIISFEQLGPGVIGRQCSVIVALPGIFFSLFVSLIELGMLYASSRTILYTIFEPRVKTGYQGPVVQN